MKKDELLSRDREQHQTACKEFLASLLGQEDFHDVTLASLDGQQVPANKAVLSYSSSLLNAILKHNRQTNPVIVCRGVNYVSGDQDLQSSGGENILSDFCAPLKHNWSVL